MNSLPDLNGDKVKQQRLAKLAGGSNNSSKSAGKTSAVEKTGKTSIAEKSPQPATKIQPADNSTMKSMPPKSANSIRFVGQSDDEWETEVRSKIRGKYVFNSEQPLIKTSLV